MMLKAGPARCKVLSMEVNPHNSHEEDELQLYDYVDNRSESMTLS
jgi:hypothetical protein